MQVFARVVTLLLVAAMAAGYFALQENRFVPAAVAIAGLVELALALRARRRGQPAEVDRSRIAAVRVACTDQGGAISVTLTGEDTGRAPAPSVLLSRGPAREDGPYLELSDRKGATRGGIQDAYLSPQLLRVTLAPRDAQALGADAVCVTLPQGSDQRLLERALGRVLRGVPFTSERSLPGMG